jgi:dihydrofolate synthase / folylpolyglutamate synthase
MVSMPHWPASFANLKHRNNLNNLANVLKLLGNPQENLPPVIQVAGTNGKGSVCAFLKSILTMHGYKIHRYTSPHITRFNERIEIANKQISDHALFAYLERVRIICPDNNYLSFFEATTAAAFLAFSENPADFCILECGMGARIDATNLVSSNILSIITNIGVDHQEFLGPNLTAIASEKVYVMRNNSLAIIAPQFRQVMNVVDYYADTINCKLFNYENDYDFTVDDENFVYIDIAAKDMIYFAKPNLTGEHQLENAALAIAAVKNLPANYKFDDIIISNALKNTTWPGRLEKINISEFELEFSENSEFWIDAAHNNAGALVLRNWLSTSDKKKNILIYGRTAGKNHNDFLNIFKNVIDEFILIEVENEPLPEKIFTLQKIAKEESSMNIIVKENLLEGLKYISDNKKIEFRCLICGSIYLNRDLNVIRKRLS